MNEQRDEGDERERQRVAFELLIDAELLHALRLEADSIGMDTNSYIVYTLIKRSAQTRSNFIDRMTRKS